jgi:Ca-activated chloride channel family protein
MFLAISFLNPARLWLLLVVLALGGAYIASQLVRSRHVVRFTSIELLDSVAPKRPHWRRHVVAGIQLAGLAVGVVALARPYTSDLEQTTTEGRIMLAFDVSLSMSATDVSPSRLDAAKEAAKDFIDQVDPGIEVGLISFSAQVRLAVPPTLDRDKLNRGIDALELGEGTAIGDAIEEAVAQLQPDRPGDDPLGSVVVLSDGETTQGQPTADGAQIAADAGVKVYTIAFGTEQGAIQDPNTGEIVPVPVKYPELAEAAEVTGGESYEAPTRSALQDAYENISADLNTGTGDPIEIRTEQTWAYAAAALALLAAAWTLSLWWLRGLV